MNLLITQAKMDTSFPLELEARAEPEHAAEAIVEARIGLPPGRSRWRGSRR
jgi:hypothetical protein